MRKSIICAILGCMAWGLAGCGSDDGTGPGMTPQEQVSHDQAAKKYTQPKGRK
jgi:hypothetical protein